VTVIAVAGVGLLIWLGVTHKGDPSEVAGFFTCLAILTGCVAVAGLFAASAAWRSRRRVLGRQHVADSYSPGCWFAVPLPQGAGFAPGLVARTEPRQDGLLLCYFFPPNGTAVPALEELHELRPEDAILVGKLGRLSEKWPKLGQAPEWDRGTWPVPAFRQVDGPQLMMVVYDDDMRFIREEVTDLEQLVVLPANTPYTAAGVVEKLKGLLEHPAPGVADAGEAAQAGTAAGTDGQAPPEPYAPGRGQKVPAPIRRFRRGYAHFGWGAVLGGLALIIVGAYFAYVYSAGFDLRYLYASLVLWASAAVLFGQYIRLGMFLRRPADACSATVTACRRGGRTLMLYSPWAGYPSGLKVRVAWWAAPEKLLPGESVTFYGRAAGVGLVLVSSPARDMAFVGAGRRRPTSPPRGQAVHVDAPPQVAGQRAGRYLRWGPPVLTILASLAVVAATVIAAAPALTGHLTVGQLTTGDCVTGPMGLGTGKTWPNVVTAVPCTQPHEGEVFFSGNAWPVSLAAYPGDNAIAKEADARCGDEFKSYDGIDISQSSFWISEVAPYGEGNDWNTGDRQLVCLAYIPDHSTPAGGLPVTYSIKGSSR
jgi:hypothetical protein